MKKEFQIISELIENNKRVLDVGCGDGTLMKHLKDNKIITEGYRTIDIAGENDHKLSTSQMGDLVAGIISSGPK